jgi:hypothetical protein
MARPHGGAARALAVAIYGIEPFMTMVMVPCDHPFPSGARCGYLDCSWRP